MCVRLLFVTNYEYQKKNPNKGKKIKTNVAYHTRTYANVHIRPPNWTYANIRNYGTKPRRFDALSTNCTTTSREPYANKNRIAPFCMHFIFHFCMHLHLPSSSTHGEKNVDFHPLAFLSFIPSTSAPNFPILV